MLNGNDCIPIQNSLKFSLTVQLAVSQYWFRWWIGTGQATCHCLILWWPRSTMPHCSTVPQWVIWYNRNTSVVTRYGQANILREVSGRPLTSRGMSAWPYLVTTKYSFYPVRTFKMLNKNNCANCALKWEIQRFDGELFSHTCMTSLAKRGDVACRVKPDGRRPEPLFNISKDCTWPIQSQNMNMDLFHT